jgi:hypothetical protein
MKTLVISVILSGSAAFAAGSWYILTKSVDAPVSPISTTAAFDSSQPLQDRIAALEQAVSEERQARQLLEDEVFYLTGEIDILSGSGYSAPPADDAPAEQQVSESRSDRRDAMRRRNSREGRIERLVAAGFLPSQADWITQREQELQMQALQARFDAESSGESVDWMANRNLAGDTLRAELGDAEYERYLEATNRSTRVAVSSVIESSPAQTAGLQPGDEIMRYDGERVFSMTDLTRQTMAGEPGQTVVVDIMRNGNLMQVVMPRGPVGVTGGRRQY